MSIRLLPLVLLLLTGCWEQPKTATWLNATGPEQFERLMWKSIQEKDWLQVESRLASTTVTLDHGKIFDKTQTLDDLKKLDLTDYMLGDFDVKPDGADAVVTYTMVAHGHFAGQPLSATLIRCMTVWQQQGKGWVVIAHVQGGPAADLQEKPQETAQESK